MAGRASLLAAAVVAAIMMLGPGTASAAVRYAAPGGTAADTECVTPAAAPCSIATAVAGPNVVDTDEAIIAPGEYSDTAGDLGVDGWVQITGGVNVHGAAGQPRPVIRQDSDPSIGALILPFGSATTRLAHVEIRTDASRSTLGVNGGIAEDLIVRSSAGVSQGVVCLHHGGTIRNSVCLSSGDGQAALGGSLSAPAQNTTLNLRNVTAVATGTGSFGLDYFFAGAGANFTISAKGVIGQGTSVDARARATTGATTTVNLDHSNFDSVSTSSTLGGVGTITAAGTGAPNFNQTTPATLAADGYHQLAGSSTINTGETDGLSGTEDIDGQQRTIGSAPDIGADELGHSTSAAVSCTPTPLAIGAGATTCTATVTDTAAGPTTPTGGVGFATSGTGAFGGGASCGLATLSASQASCPVSYTPAQVGTDQITASYAGDATHEASQDTGQVDVVAPVTQTPSLAARCATLRKKLKAAKKRGDKAKVRKLRRKLRRLGC